MSLTEFCEMLETTEPVFQFRGIEYQICMLKGRFLAGVAESEKEDQWFDTIDELLYKWELQEVPLVNALAEIVFTDGE